MNNFVVERWHDDCGVCALYTVRFENHEYCETDKFLTSTRDEYREELDRLISFLINQIANRYGALDEFFNRHENLANALPPKGSKRLVKLGLDATHAPLRLYCLRISEEILILFNGGPKTSQTAQGSPGLSMKFNEAQIFARKIISALQDGLIVEKDKELTDFQGNSEIVIY